jgi:hypothetical protein
MSETAVKRNSVGHLLPGQSPIGANHIYKGEPSPGSEGRGRLWLSEEERKLIRELCPELIKVAFTLIQSPSVAPEYKIKAIDTILAYAYGTPQIATLVRYEVDLIIEAYGLPSRNQLVGKDGQKLFGNRGGFKPSQRYTSAWDRQEAIKRIKTQQEDEPIVDPDVQDPKPEVHIYPTQASSKGQEQPRPIGPLSK